MPRLAAPFALLLLAGALLAGCGSSSDQSSKTEQRPAPAAPVGAAAKSCETGAVDAEGLRVSGVSCQVGRRVMYGWQRARACAPAAAASRSGCRAASYRCASVRSGRGLAVSCARPGRSIAFVAKRR